MDFSNKNKSFIQPQPLAELLPALTGILSKDECNQIMASAKKSRTTMMPQTTNKNFSIKPRTMAEMRDDILALKAPSPKRYGHSASTMKSWNSSVKVDQKKVSHTGGKNVNKHASVRKVLNFQSKPKPQVLFNSGTCMTNATPKFLKPQIQAKKKLPIQVSGKNSVRISGIYAIPQTPLEKSTKVHPISRLTTANKENIPRKTNAFRKSLAPPKVLINNLKILHQPIVPDTPLSNTSSDASFLQKEKEINDSELKNTSEMLENIAEISPPVSTPFKNYRSVHEYFMDDSNDLDKTEINIDNTITVFDKSSVATENKKEESIIVSLCDLLNKATITNSEGPTNELTELLEMEKQTIDSVKWIENCITIMSKIKHTHEASLKNIQKLIAKERSMNDKDRTLVMEELELSVKTETATINNEVTRHVSVIKYTRSPSYTIPKKNGGMRKKVFHKSMPSALNVYSPENTMNTSNRAISMYLEMKNKLNFLNTPLAKRRPSNVPPDTPAVTSRNLQMQLDRLYNNS